VKIFAMLVVPAVTAALGIPLLLNAIPPNSFYGFRTQRSLSSETIWFATNRALGGALILVGGIAILANLAIDRWAKNLSSSELVVVFLVVDTTLLLPALLAVGLYSRTL
jgi:uncharacterized membrane protein